ncbi:jg24484 [Pararge aegeria aegeria]|uniref:Jg24484 protein n=1 Tax=Pararge aegeria aegeria TaxID=348720 RepID=A0A8S4RGV6_9NEOP|nr:jg24484 [Pararge aegeria aegeria]
MTPRMKLAIEIRKLSSSFVRTCEVLRELNDIENFFLLVHIIIVSMTLVVTINNLAQVLCCTTGNDLKYAILKQCVWFVCHIFRIIVIVEPCHRISEEFSKTKMLVAQMMCEVTCEADPLFEATDDFFNQLLLNDVSFTVMGICSLKRSTIFTVNGPEWLEC